MRPSSMHASVFAILLAVSTAAACKSESSSSSSSSSESKPALPGPEAANEKAPDRYKAKFSTSEGDFVIEVVREWAPLGADRFYNLVKIGFYDGARFFRVMPGFVVQWGIHADGQRVMSRWGSADIQDDPVKQSNEPGMVSFAMAGPNTRSTQVFINYGNNSKLDSMGFAPFGKVIEGMDVVQRIYSGYGQSPNQGRIQSEGNAYLQREFPELDFIKKAEIAK